MEENMTAVAWLISKLPLRYKNAIMNDCKEEIQQAKEMEKVQMLDAILLNQKGLITREKILEAKKYYNETYKN